MSAPTMNKKSAYPFNVDDLLPAAQRLAVELGEVPSRNKLKAALKIGAPKATAVLAELMASDFDPVNPPADVARLRLVPDDEPAKPVQPKKVAPKAPKKAEPGRDLAPETTDDEVQEESATATVTAEPVTVDQVEKDTDEPGLQDVAATAKTVLSGAAIGWLTRPKPERQARRVPWPARILAVVAALASTGSALAISYTETMALGMHAGYSEGMSLLIPLTADGLLMTGIVTAAVRMIRGEKAGFRPFLALIVGGAAAIGANVAARYFGVDTDTPQALWPWIPVVMAAYIPTAALLAAEQGLALIRDNDNA